LLKIGQTTLDPHERARQLSAATAAATPFHVIYKRWSDDANDAEARVHEILDQYRINDSREFFKVSVYQAVMAIDMVCGGTSDWGMKLPWSELFNSFPDHGDGVLNEEEQAACRKLERKLGL